MPLHACLNQLTEKCRVHVAKMFSLPKIFCAIWLINQSYFLVTFTTMSTICNMSVKLLLFNFPVFTIVTMRTSIIMKPCPKFLWTSCVFFMVSFARYQINYILDLQFRFSGLISYVRFVVGTICFQISHLGPLQGLRQTLFLIWGTFALTSISFKLLALRNPIIGTSLNTLLCSLWLLIEPEKGGT